MFRFWVCFLIVRLLLAKGDGLIDNYIWLWLEIYCNIYANYNT